MKRPERAGRRHGKLPRLCGRRSGRLADDQPRLQEYMTGVSGVPALKLLHQKPDRVLGDLLFGLGDGGERQAQPSDQVDVVEADHGEVRRQGKAMLLGDPEDSQAENVVGGKDGRGARIQARPLEGSHLAGLLGPPPFPDEGRNLRIGDAALQEAVLETPDPEEQGFAGGLTGSRRRGISHGGEDPMSKAQQVRGGQASPHVVVHQHPVARNAVNAAVEENARDPQRSQGAVRGPARFLQGRGNHESIHAVFQQLKVVDFQVAGGSAQDHVRIAPEQLLVQKLGNFVEERVLDVLHQRKYLFHRGGDGFRNSPIGAPRQF